MSISRRDFLRSGTPSSESLVWYLYTNRAVACYRIIWRVATGTGPVGAVSSYLFVSNWGNRLDSGEIHRTFYALSRKIGLRGPTDSHGPRLQDLRHRFAVLTLLRWYRAGEDPERRLPTLSAYLGHVHISDTFWYLSGWPELMQEAMSRLERCWEDRA